MPRGRKRPPQESIDSILLAISRRDDIDPDTLSHYFERLDEEWTEGARDKVLHLLRTRDSSAHAAAVLILSELATDFDLEELEDLVADPTVSDMAKLSLAPILKELGSEMADEGLIEYMNDPEAAMQRMQMRLLDLVGQSEIGVEAVLEDMLSMPLDKRLSFINWLGQSHDPRAANLLIPLLENQTSKVLEAVIDALEQLGAIAAPQSIPALNHLVAQASNREIKQHARAVLGRLTMQSAPGIEEATATVADQQQLQFHEAHATFIDGTGAQIVMLAWQLPDGLLKSVNVFYQDQWGIKDCYGSEDLNVDHWNEIVNNMHARGVGSVQVSLEFARALIAEARAVTKRTRHKLPIAYSIWRPLIEGEASPVSLKSSKKKAPTISTKLEPAGITPEVLELAQRGNELYQMSEFMSWMYMPLERIQPYIDRYWSNRILSGGLNIGSRGRGRKREQQKHKSALAMEILISEAINELIDNHWRALYEERLLHQGALFELARRTEDVQLVQAVAAVLHPDSGIPAEEQPFVQAMMRISIEQGPVRALAEALDAGKLGPLPLDLFPGLE